MSWLLRLKGYALSALAAIAAILFALVYGYTKGSKAGANAVAAKATNEVIKATETRNEVETKIQRQPDGRAAKELKDKWSRD